MLQVLAALLYLHALLAFLCLPVTWNCKSWSSYAIMGSKYGLRLCACSLITTLQVVT